MKYPRNQSFFTKERSPRGVSDLGEVFPPQVPEARNMRYPEKFCSRTWEWRDRQEERGAKAFGEGRHEEHGRPDADVLQGNQKNFSVASEINLFSRKKGLHGVFRISERFSLPRSRKLGTCGTQKNFVPERGSGETARRREGPKPSAKGATKSMVDRMQMFCKVTRKTSVWRQRQQSFCGTS